MQNLHIHIHKKKSNQTCRTQNVQNLHQLKQFLLHQHLTQCKDSPEEGHAQQDNSKKRGCGGWEISHLNLVPHLTQNVYATLSGVQLIRPHRPHTDLCELHKNLCRNKNRLTVYLSKGEKSYVHVSLLPSSQRGEPLCGVCQRCSCCIQPNQT